MRHRATRPGGIRFGLYNTAEVLVDTAVRTDPNSGNGAVGYYANISSGTTSNSLLRRENSGTDGYTAGADFAAVGTANTTTNPGLDDTDLHTASLTITRTAGGVSISSVVDNVTLATGTNASPYLTYNTFAVGNGSLTGTVLLDDVLVQYTPVPEPATAALSLAGLAGLVVRRRR